MKLNLNLFGFEIQISRPAKYGVLTLYSNESAEGMPWFDLMTSSFLVAYLYGWAIAREKAMFDKTPASFLIFRLQENYVMARPLIVRTIQIRSSVAFFSK